MITSKSKAIETDCRSLLVYIKLLCDSTRTIWTFWRVPLQKATLCKQRKVRFAILTNITSLSNQYLSIVAIKLPWINETTTSYSLIWPTKQIFCSLVDDFVFLKVCVGTHLKVLTDWNVQNDAFICKCTTKMIAVRLPIYLIQFTIIIMAD